MYPSGATCLHGRDQGRIQYFKLGGAHLKKLRRAEGGAKNLWIFRVKNHDFTPESHIFSNFRCVGGGGGRRVRPLLDSPPPGSAPGDNAMAKMKKVYKSQKANDLATRTLPTSRGGLRCTGKVGRVVSSCSSSGTRHCS